MDFDELDLGGSGSSSTAKPIALNSSEMRAAYDDLVKKYPKMNTQLKQVMSDILQGAAEDCTGPPSDDVIREAFRHHRRWIRLRQIF